MTVTKMFKPEDVERIEKLRRLRQAAEDERCHLHRTKNGYLVIIRIHQRRRFTRFISDAKIASTNCADLRVLLGRLHVEAFKHAPRRDPW